MYFGSDSASTEEVDCEENQGIKFAQPVEGADPGVELEARMSASELASRLGFGDDNVPFLFNNQRHCAGFSAWSQEFEDAAMSKSTEFEPLSLQWHQLAGVHAALRKVLSPVADPSHGTGVLFADDVGLGKTIQASTIMASLSELSIQQERGLKVPPIFRELSVECYS
jgi:TATA-binding protein-associated factor